MEQIEAMVTVSTDVRTSRARRAQARERMELILNQLDQLPTLPAVAGRLLQLTGSDESSSRDVVEIIASDPPLSAAVLRMIHRADLGVADRSATVSRAVMLLGFRAIRNLVLSVQVFETLVRPGSNGSVAGHREGIWKHSLAVACVAEMLAEGSGQSAVAEEAFVCGLLHDIGKIALDACMPKSYQRVIERVDREHVCICDVEQETFGLDHTVAGKRLALRWKLSPSVVDCIWLHHQGADALASSVAHPQLVRTVHLADSLVRLHGIGLSGYPIVGDIDELVMELNLDEEAPVELMARLSERMKPLLEVLDLHDRAADPCSWRSLAKANRQLSQINTRLSERNRRLEMRSAGFEIMHRFTERLSEQDGLGDVCTAAAEAVRTMTDAYCAVAFAGDPSQRYIHVGLSNGSDPQARADIVDLGSPTEVRSLLNGSSAAPAGSVVAASEHCEGIWRRCGSSSIATPIWMLPIAREPDWICAVLFDEQDSNVERLRSATVECGALASAIRLALSSAKTRTESERMNQELLDSNRRVRATQQLLVRSRSMAMIAEMAAGAAHELNNPLSVISGWAQLLLGDCDDSKRERGLEVIVEQTKRAAGIVTDLMNFAKPAKPDGIVQSLREVLGTLCQHWQAASKLAEHQLVLSLSDPNTTVYADPDQLREILTAVVGNAVSATRPETARLQINSRSCLSDETVRIAVSDNGVGMTHDVLEHALDPFFSSRSAGRGRGLGLSRAYRLAEMNGGRLWLESTPGQGTTVTIELPTRAPQA